MLEMPRLTPDETGQAVSRADEESTTEDARCADEDGTSAGRVSAGPASYPAQVVPVGRGLVG
jgi:hypothetical protein